MADKEQKPQRDQGVKSGGTVGRDVPDESKERHTEIAVEAGRKGAASHPDGEHKDDDKP